MKDLNQFNKLSDRVHTQLNRLRKRPPFLSLCSVSESFLATRKKKGSVMGLMFVMLIFANGYAQNRYSSESVITYDITNHTTDKAIPFDRAFTLFVRKTPFTSIEGIDLYESSLNNGVRMLKIDETRGGVETAILDYTALYRQSNDSLWVYIPPIRPGKYFDIVVKAHLGAVPLSLLHDTHVKLLAGDINGAESSYLSYLRLVGDPHRQTRVGFIPFPGYRTFYDSLLNDDYTALNDPANFPTSVGLTMQEIVGIDSLGISRTSDFKYAPLLTEATRRALWNEIQRGQLDLQQLLSTKHTTVPLTSFTKRTANIKSSLTILDSLLGRVDRMLSKGIDSVKADAQWILISKLRTNVVNLRASMQANSDSVGHYANNISEHIKANRQLRHGHYLSGRTISSDLKTAGGNLLFLDLGISNIFTEGVQGKNISIPKLHYGVSIYFRPIDKNTRRNTFSRPHATTGADTLADFNIVTRPSIWQHLSLNLGFTLGAMQPKEFDNLYNSTSLLVGPAYRFARGFKVSGGWAFLRRDSRNPLISEKKTINGFYMSLSIDVDIVQGIKDVTSILFK